MSDTISNSDKRLGEILRHLRVEAYVTMEALLTHCRLERDAGRVKWKFSKSDFSPIEKGKFPSDEKLAAYCKIFHVELADLRKLAQCDTEISIALNDVRRIHEFEITVRSELADSLRQCLEAGFNLQSAIPRELQFEVLPNDVKDSTEFCVQLADSLTKAMRGDSRAAYCCKFVDALAKEATKESIDQLFLLTGWLLSTSVNPSTELVTGAPLNVNTNLSAWLLHSVVDAMQSRPATYRFTMPENPSKLPKILEPPHALKIELIPDVLTDSELTELTIRDMHKKTGADEEMSDGMSLQSILNELEATLVHLQDSPEHVTLSSHLLATNNVLRLVNSHPELSQLKTANYSAENHLNLTHSKVESLHVFLQRSVQAIEAKKTKFRATDSEQKAKENRTSIVIHGQVTYLSATENNHT